jgi:trans-aconitate 2-methyltransferase
MSWDPQVYLTFGGERTRPAVELAARVGVPSPTRIIDLGCGPGNSTAVLAARWPSAVLEGLDSSPDMLTQARRSGVPAAWTQGDVASWIPRAGYDLIFSSAMFHWIPNHRELLPRLMEGVVRGGALAFQVPDNFNDPWYVLLRQTAEHGSWKAALASVPRIQVEKPDSYFDILHPLSKTVDIWQTTYLHVLEGEDPVLRWVSGTALRPYIERLTGADHDGFIEEYGQKLRDTYPMRADNTTLFPFRRLFAISYA